MKDEKRQLVLKYLRRRAYPELQKKSPLVIRASWVCVRRDERSMTWVAAFSGKAPEITKDGWAADGKECVLLGQECNIGLSWLRTGDLVEALECGDHDGTWLFPIDEVWRKKWASA